MSPRLAIACAFALMAMGCGVERRPPTLVVSRGSNAAPIHRVILLPTECPTKACTGLDAIAASELAFRGIDVIELERLAAVERTRIEVDVSTSVAIDGATPTTDSHRRVTVFGPRMSDVDVWTMREQLATLGVDAVVRVRTATIEASPLRVVAVVRVTRVADASLVWATSCELEPSSLSTPERAAELALRCALRGAVP